MSPPEISFDTELQLQLNGVYGSTMKNMLAVVALLATAEVVAETFIGRIYVSDGGTVSNATTGYGSPGCASQTSPGGAGACDQAFPIGTNIKLTIQCDAIAYVSSNRGTTDAGIGMKLAVDEKFPTSVSSARVQTDLPDGGSYSGGLLSIAPAVGAAAVRCNVHYRSGTE